MAGDRSLTGRFAGNTGHRFNHLSPTGLAPPTNRVIMLTWLIMSNSITMLHTSVAILSEACGENNRARLIDAYFDSRAPEYHCDLIINLLTVIVS